MTDLPPDLDRLLVIESYLRRQIDEVTAVGTYLDQQLSRVRDAIAGAQDPAPPPVAEIGTWRGKTSPGKE